MFERTRQARVNEAAVLFDPIAVRMTPSAEGGITQWHVHGGAQEAQAWAHVRPHPNIVRFYDAWMEPAARPEGAEHCFIWLEKCGETVGQRVNCGGDPFTEPELLDLLRQVTQDLVVTTPLSSVNRKPDGMHACSLVNQQDVMYTSGSSSKLLCRRFTRVEACWSCMRTCNLSRR